MDDMQNLMNTHLADSFLADAERRWLYGHPYRAERPRRARAVVRRAARAGRPAATRRHLRARAA
jgi:hypothetical protein